MYVYYGINNIYKRHNYDFNAHNDNIATSLACGAGFLYMLAVCVAVADILVCYHKWFS